MASQARPKRTSQGDDIKGISPSCSLTLTAKYSARHLSQQAGRRAKWCSALTKAGGNFHLLPPTFDVYDQLHRTMTTRHATLFGLVFRTMCI